MLPKQPYLLPLFYVISMSIPMKTNSFLRSVIIVTISKSSHPNTNLLPLKYHGQMLIIRYIHHKMPPRKTKPRRPIRLQRRSTVNPRNAFRLLPVPNIRSPPLPLKIALAHYWPRHTFPIAVRMNRSLNIRQVRRQHRHLVIRRMPLGHNIYIPIVHKIHVRVQLHRKIFPAVQTMTNVTREHRADGELRLHRVHVDLINVLTYYSIFGGTIAAVSGNARVVAVVDLIVNGHAYSLRVFGA
mmetsp:Transcript_19571/g.24195  ORF Transcript_19571/g.24195 Transcript_19571/m.24195 type:complete len:241 (+) Transcript_19571:460-1182(+)